MIREEIKNKTAKMLKDTEPSTDPPLEENEGPPGPSATDASEIDGGFEFVPLTPAKPVDARKKNQESVKSPPKAAKKTPKALQKEIAKKLVKVKDLLQAKKIECQKLDGLHGENAPKPNPDSAKQKDDSEDESEITDSNHTIESCKGSDTQQKPKVNPAIQREFDTDKEAILAKVQDVKHKMRQLNLYSPPPELSTLGGPTKTSVSTSTVSSTSGSTGSKKQKTSGITENAIKKSDSTPTVSGVSASTGSKKQKAASKASGQSQSSKKLVTTVFKLPSAEDLLLLTLLPLSSQQRDDYIEKIGKERSFLVPGKKKKGSMEIDPMWVPLANELKSRALTHAYGRQWKEYQSEDGISRPFLAVSNLEKVQDAKKIRQPRIFEDEVSYLLNNGKTTEKKDYKQELTLENVSKAEHNGFLTEQNKTALNQLVERLVVEGVGYVVEGVLRVNGTNNAQAFVDDHTREADVFINSILLRKCAMDGDFVKVFVKHGEVTDVSDSASLPRSVDEIDDGDGQLKLIAQQERPKNNWGFVVEILEKRHSRSCVGSFIPSAQANNEFLKFVPRDSRIPVMRVNKQNWPEALFKKKSKDIESVIYQAEIIEWKNDIPIGTIVKSIGLCGELESENQAILIEYDLDVSPYSDAIINSLPSSPFLIPEEEIARREDLRDECVFTIDPLTARDLDDALSCKMLKNGNYLIGVHISDVSYFLQEGSELDELVKLRATSIYMVDNVYHMLPKPLCFLCSLLPGEDKMAFSVFWEITPDAKVLNTRFARTVINSCCQLAYEHAQVMLDKPNENLNSDDFPKMYHGYTANYLSRIVNLLQSIAVQLRARRMENGCLRINQPKLSFTLDPSSGKPTAYNVYELRTANQMIEDFMLLANASVAELCYSKFADLAILRNHYSPSEAQMNGVAKVLAKHGRTIRVESSKSIAESLEAIIASCPQPDAARAVLNVMLAKPMTRARYFCSAFASHEEDFYHYALAIPMYTHFTSPIRRYADCMVHRVLSAALELTDPPSRTPEELGKLTGICNIKKYNAKLAGDASSLLYFRHYLQNVGSIETEAAVMDIAQHHLELVLIETGHVIRINHKRLTKSLDIKVTEVSNHTRHCVFIPRDTNIPSANISLFSKVRVTVELVKNVITITSVLPLATSTTELSSDAIAGVSKCPLESSDQ
ncbi:DIS3-like exonuclease 2 isoform X2 [Topomyia yanbarensis]|nr:DIS3-like exonuclease 2 isoform X2 [Topomyia yanbarensis]